VWKTISITTYQPASYFAADHGYALKPGGWLVNQQHPDQRPDPAAFKQIGKAVQSSGCAKIVQLVYLGGGPYLGGAR
jgi:hypothetical protein